MFRRPGRRAVRRAAWLGVLVTLCLGSPLSRSTFREPPGVDGLGADPATVVLDRWPGGILVAGARVGPVRFPVGSDTGENPTGGSVLSPDGRRLAVPGSIIDVGNGWLSSLSSPTDIDYEEIVPQAWSPDGRYVATVNRRGDDDGDGQAKSDVAIFDTGTGESRPITTITGEQIGWTVAFSPDGSRLAVQTPAGIAVYRTDGRLDHRVATTGRLAGRGAWTPDGTGLLTVTPAGEDGPVTWTVQAHDATTGAPRGPVWTVDDVVGVRAIGWAPDSSPIVVMHRWPHLNQNPDGGPVVPEAYMERNYDIAASAHADVVALGSGRVLLRTQDGTASVDIADATLATGAVPVGRWPAIRIIWRKAGPELATLALFLVLLIGRKRRPSAPAGWMTH